MCDININNINESNIINDIIIINDININVCVCVY